MVDLVWSGCKKARKYLPVEIKVGEKNTKMKEKVTTMIDHNLKELFDRTKSIHNLTFGEAFELGIRSVLIRLNQANIIEQECSRKDLEINKLTLEQNELRQLVEQIKSLKIPVIEINKNNRNGNSTEDIDLYRDKRFQESYSSEEKMKRLRDNLEKCNINWDRIIELYKFKNKDEARNWIELRLK